MKFFYSQRTVNVAVADDWPTTLKATQVYCPALPPVTADNTREFPSTPGMATPSKSHEIWGCGLPSVMQVNSACVLRGMEILVGGWRMVEGSVREERRGEKGRG